MTNIVINSMAIDDQQNNIDTIEDLLKVASLTKNEGIVTNINIDGQSYTDDELEKELYKKISTFKTVKLTVLSRFELALDSVNTSGQYTKVINSKIDSIISAYRNNDNKDANLGLSDLTEMLQLFLTLTSKVFITCTSANGPDVTEISNSYESQKISLIGVLNSIIDAHQRGDVTIICDLLEYELKDNLDLWNNDTLLKMTQLLTSFL